jgi:uncharacterized protein HemX
MCVTRPAITYTQFPSGQEIYASASASASPSASGTASSSAATSSAATSSGISKGAIAGIVLGVLVLIAVLLGACLFCLRRKRRSKEEETIVEAPANEHKPIEYYQYNAPPGTAGSYSSNHQLQQQQRQHDRYGGPEEGLHEAPGSIAAVEAGESQHPVELPASSEKK